MTDHIPQEQGEFLLFQAEDGSSRIQCRFENQSIWLIQATLADLYQVSVPTINEHLKGIFAERELDPEATIRKFQIVRTEGSRQVSRHIEHYELNAVLAFSGKTAHELILERADHLKPNMGVTTFKGKVVRKTDVTVAKNYLNEEEISELNRVVTMFSTMPKTKPSAASRAFSKTGKNTNSSRPAVARPLRARPRNNSRMNWKKP
jgi:hypothetical protein